MLKVPCCLVKSGNADKQVYQNSDAVRPNLSSELGSKGINETSQLKQSDAMQTILKRQYCWTASANVGKLPILPVLKASSSIRAASKLVGTVARYLNVNIVCIEGGVWIEQCRNVSIRCVGITWLWRTILQLTVGRIPSTNMEQKHSWISWDETPPPISDKKSTFCLTGLNFSICFIQWALRDFLSPSVLAPICACSSHQIWEIRLGT